MESRLPKPKIIIKKAFSITDVTVKNNNHKMIKNCNSMLTSTSLSTSISSSTLTSMSTSTDSISMKSMNENKLPVKQALMQAETLSTITRSNDMKAIKRIGINVIHGKTKKPLVKPVAKINKVIQNDIGNKAGKIKKCDLRNRLAQTNDKLSVAQQKNEEIESKYNVLQELVNTLKASETAYKTKAEKLEASNNTLTNELQTLTAETFAIQENQEDLMKRLKESEESCTSLSHTLQEFQEKYKKQEVLILEQTKQLTDELSVAQQKNKDIESKYNILQELVNTLKASETAYKTKAEKLEASNNTLTNELQTLTTEMFAIRKNQEDLMKRLNESEELCANFSHTLHKFEEKYKTQEILVSEQTEQLTALRTDLILQKEVNEELSIVKEKLQALTHKMDKERRILHNTIQELKGNIRVFCRVRPRTPKEIEQMKTLCNISFIDDCTIEIGKSDGSDAVSCSGKLRGIKQEFSFDKVFTPNTLQADVFEELSFLVQSALEGYNVCVFAYGQTGSGKTYTMEGECGLQTEGMIPRTVRHIFKEMKQFELFGWKYRIEASFLEIYNEHIIDLLDSQPKTHEIRMVDSKGQDLYVSNLRIEEIYSPEELHECLRTAQRNRAVVATQSNERSSRSHLVTRIRLIGTHTEKQEVLIGNLNLVDLAGSERLKTEEAARTAETKNINKSLANLGNVILALLKKQEHIPYRNSKLTHLLMPSLGGNSKTLMLLNISPLDECYNETLNSLRFASNVNNCKIGNVKRSRMVLQNMTH